MRRACVLLRGRGLRLRVLSGECIFCSACGDSKERVKDGDGGMEAERDTGSGSSMMANECE